MSQLHHLLEYLGLSRLSTSLEARITGPPEKFGGLKAHLPLIVDNEEFQQFAGKKYSWLNQEESIRPYLFLEIDIDNEKEFIIDLQTPARALGIANHYPPQLAEQFCLKYAGHCRFLSREEIVEQGLLTNEEPGDYFTLTFSSSSLVPVFNDPLLIEVIRGFTHSAAERVNQKMRETVQRLRQLKQLSPGESVVLDYLDVHNAPDYLSSAEYHVLDLGASLSTQETFYQERLPQELPGIPATMLRDKGDRGVACRGLMLEGILPSLKVYLMTEHPSTGTITLTRKSKPGSKEWEKVRKQFAAFGGPLYDLAPQLMYDAYGESL